MNISKKLAGLSAVALFALINVDAQAIALFGTYASGNDLILGGSEDGGVGSSSASVTGPTYAADVALSGSSYTPVLRAQSVSTNPVYDDDRTDAHVEAYQTFTSSVAQTITLNLSLHGVVTPDTGGNPYVLGDVSILGGAGYMVSSSYCSNGVYAFPNGIVGFGAYICGSNLGSSNLYIGDGDTTVNDTITFNVAAGESFGVYSRLIANSYAGSADAFNTFTMSFDDDTYLTAASVSAVPVPAAAWLFASGLLGMIGVARRRNQILPA